MVVGVAVIVIPVAGVMVVIVMPVAVVVGWMVVTENETAPAAPMGVSAVAVSRKLRAADMPPSVLGGGMVAVPG
jgi:hypothetical protein